MRKANFGALVLGGLFLVISAFIIAVMFGWTNPLQTIVQEISGNRIYSSLTALGFLLLGVLSFSLINFGKRDQSNIATSTQFGQIRISDSTIEGIVSRAGSNVEGIKEVTPRIHPTPEGINIYVKAVINSDFSIPKVVEEMQALVKEEVEKYTGLKVSEVKVMVQSINSAGSNRTR